MAKKVLTRADFEEVGNVVPTPEEAEFNYSIIYFTIHAKDKFAELSERQEQIAKANFWEVLKSGNFDSAEEALEYLRSEWKKQPAYQHIADTKDEAVEYLMENLFCFREGRSFIKSREERFRSTFCKEFLAPLMLAGMRSGELLNSWWRAVCYGFSVEPYNEVRKKGEEVTYNAFPYRSLEEMKEEDRRAFLWTVEDTYYENLDICVLRQGKRVLQPSELLEEEEITFTPYPEDGYSEVQIAESHSSEEEPTTVEDLYGSWEYDMELYFPSVIHAQDEALYYAMKYSGTEYLHYVRDLNVGQIYEECTNTKYNDIMKEGYVWHSEK